MAKFLVTGGTGFIGTRLVRDLAAAGHQAVVLTRNPDKHQGRNGDSVRYLSRFEEIDSNTLFTAVINLGGEGIGDKRWSEKRKTELLDSRIGLTNQLVTFLATLETRPEVMISGSAIGWYGAQDEKPLTEEDSFNPEFTHDLCQQWEDAAGAVIDLGIRLCIIRMGVVLGRDGGVLKRMLPPFYFGLGGRIGTGRQYMTWVHMTDVIKGINFLVRSPELDGVFNLTAPGAVTNAEFTRGIGLAISRPTIFPLPAFMVKLLFGEMGDRLLLQGQHVVPARLLQAGFVFDYPALKDALTESLVR